ncbi:putative signal peptide and transmembrane protein [Rhodopirellula islandica]|uniref:Signal peptide and transmembrane protein n=2 Tax=Rhodopirellula islandica TaxID=595434 RepID=A0A0J1BBD4_RHOIS|nr:putative signal peptide and transmembrane protein [Rhodopirellula islandica]
MAVLSLAAISIVRSHRRSNVRSANVRQQVEGRLVAEGLIHRNVALARANGALPVASLDTELGTTSFPDAWMAPPVMDVANQTVSLQVYMYPGATVPAASLTTSVPSVAPAPQPSTPAPAVVAPSAF